MNTLASFGPKARPVKTAAKNTGELRIPDKMLGHLSQVFQMLSDPSRLKILMMLAQNAEMTVTAIRELLGHSQPAVSHHLRLLRMWGLVSFRRDGKRNFYRVDTSYLGDLLEQFFRDAGNSSRQFEFADFRLAYCRK